MFSALIVLADDAMRAGESLGVDAEALAAILLTSSSACVASGVRTRGGRLADLAACGIYVTLVKDVTLMASLLGDVPGRELVDVAQRFSSAMTPTDR